MSIKVHKVDSSNIVRNLAFTYYDAGDHQVYVSNNVIKVNIANGAENPILFAGYTSISFGTNMKLIGDGCCMKFINLRYVQFGNNVEVIGRKAFYMCGALGDIVIPASTTEIGEYAFYGCSSIGSISFPQHEMLISYYAFSNSGIRSLNINVGKSIADGAFSLCRSLYNASIYGQLSNKMFSECTSLTSILIGANSRIPLECFSGCISLATVNFLSPASLVSIEDGAFAGCSSLAKLELANTALTSLGNYIFSGTSIKSIELPPSINTPAMLNEVFLGGSQITEVKFLGMTALQILDNKESFSTFGSPVADQLKFVSSDGQVFDLNFEDPSLPPQLVAGDATVYIITVTLQRNLEDKPLSGSNKDATNFIEEIYSVYDSINRRDLILGISKLSDEGTSGYETATKANINNAFNTAINSGAKLLLFLFSDHGSSGRFLCVWPTPTNNGEYNYAYNYVDLYANLARFDYSFVLLDCCYPNCAKKEDREAFENTLKNTGKRSLFWTAGGMGLRTYGNGKGHLLELKIKDKFNVGYSWQEQFNAIPQPYAKGTDRETGEKYILSARVYNYNDFPITDPVFRVTNV